MKTTKGGKVMNPTDAFRKEQRKREIKRNKKERKKEYEEKMKEKGEPPVMFSHLGPPRRLSTAEEEERVKHPKPEDSVYYHPTLNPTGAPPPGKPPMFKSSIGPRILLGEASTSGTATSESELEDATMTIHPPPPPSLPHSGDVKSAEDSILPESLPIPPPPPIPSTPAVVNLGSTSLPPLPPPPQPPGPPPKEQNASHPLLPPPPPLPESSPGTAGSEKEKGQSVKMADAGIRSSVERPTGLPPPPPPPGLPLKPVAASSDSDAKVSPETIGHAKMLPLPPPPPIRPPMAGPAMFQVQPDVLHPGISHFPPPPPDMRPPGIAGHHVASGMMAPLIQGAPFGPLLGPPPMMRPPLPPGPPPIMMNHNNMAQQFAPQKPSYVKSAASTVVKRPLAQHTPELTAMVPASVRVRRESALPKPKLKPSTASAAGPAISRPVAAPIVTKQVSTSTLSAPKPPSIDDSYMAFLEDMKTLGALEG